MAEELIIATGDKVKKYEELIPQVHALIKGESNLIANLSNVNAAIQMTFNQLWVGYYLVDGDQLVLGPFQGPIACTRINKGKGVCGTAWEKESTIIVANVEEFPGHIACSSASVSEIVVPLLNQKGSVIGVLDIDSMDKASFDQTDAKYLEQINQLITANFSHE